MLFSIFANPQLTFMQKIMYILINLFCVLLSLSVHELSHGMAAYWMGDETAKYSGRLSLNPLRHLDPIGALCLFFFSFGWARPVPINPSNFKYKKGGTVITSLAGPLSNFILAFLAEVGLVALGKISFSSDTSLTFQLASVCAVLCSYLAIMNIGLGVFNLIPIPPLDGSKVLNAVLPARIYFKIMQYERYGFIALILLINLPFFNVLLAGIRTAILSGFDTLIGLFI